MQPHDKRIIHASSSADWRTPPDLFRALNRQFHFVLDAAASAQTTCVRELVVPPYYGPDHPDTQFRDALAIPCWRQAIPGMWGQQNPSIFLNPPWSRDLLRTTKSPAYDIAVWAETAASQAALGATVVGIFPFSHQTKWWQQWIRHGERKAHEIREIPHRVSFLRPDGSPADNAGGNTAVVIWQPNPGYVGDWQPLQRVWDYR